MIEALVGVMLLAVMLFAIMLPLIVAVSSLFHWHPWGWWHYGAVPIVVQPPVAQPPVIIQQPTQPTGPSVTEIALLMLLQQQMQQQQPPTRAYLPQSPVFDQIAAPPADIARRPDIRIYKPVEAEPVAMLMDGVRKQLTDGRR